MKTFTRIVSDPSQSLGDACGSHENGFGHVLFEGYQLERVYRFSTPTTNNEHKPNSMYQNYTFGHFKCTTLVL